MPTYDFSCQGCSLAYSKFLRSRASRPEAPCPACATVNLAGLGSPGHVFQDGRDVQRDPDARGESGVYGLDYSTDKNVGRDAAARWESVKDRDSSKRQLHHDYTRPWRNKGAIPAGLDAKVALKRNPISGEYEPMMTGEVRANVAYRGDGRAALQDHRRARAQAGIPELDASSGPAGDLAQGREAFGPKGAPVVKPPAPKPK
jgi:putative FmdB family regulatory protein